MKLLSRLQNSNTSFLFWNLFTGLKFLNGLNIKSFFSLKKFSIPLSHHISMTLYPFSLLTVTTRTLFTLCHSYQTTAQSHSPLLPTCFTSSLEPACYTSLRIPYPNYSSWQAATGIELFCESYIRWLQSPTCNSATPRSFALAMGKGTHLVQTM